MERDLYLAHLARDGRRMADLADGDLDAPVPTCPDWTLRDLLEHTSGVHRWQTEAARHDHGSFPNPSTFAKPRPEGESIADWFQAGVDDAVATMSKIEPEAPRWTWAKPSGGDTAQWYFRRIAQETLVHRIDAELAMTGTFEAADPAFALDGIDEMFDMFVPASGPEEIGGTGETVHLHATDIDGEYLVTLQPTTITVERGHAKGDAAVRGTATDLLLFVWGRDLGQLERFGDDAAIDRLLAGFKL
jgi:uncharacterized protein (TIGR03083 family)